MKAFAIAGGTFTASLFASQALAVDFVQAAPTQTKVPVDNGKRILQRHLRREPHVRCGSGGLEQSNRWQGW